MVRFNGQKYSVIRFLFIRSSRFGPMTLSQLTNKLSIKYQKNAFYQSKTNLKCFVRSKFFLTKFVKFEIQSIFVVMASLTFPKTKFEPNIKNIEVAKI